MSSADMTLAPLMRETSAAWWSWSGEEKRREEKKGGEGRGQRRGGKGDERFDY